MSHITNPFQLLIKERRAKRKVIWAILLTNMGHITNQYGPYYSPTPNPSPRERGRKALP